MVVVVVPRVDLEDVAVPGVGGDRLGLFTGQPGAPWGFAAGAVALGAGQADVFRDLVALLVDDDGGRATEARRVVHELAADLGDRGDAARTELAVAHQAD